MNSSVQKRRLWALAWLLVAAFVYLGVRLVDYQLIRHEELRRLARNNTEYSQLREPRRGDILDSKGEILATTRLVKTVCADPLLLNDGHRQVARALAPHLKMSKAQLLDALELTTWVNDEGKVVTNQFVKLQEEVAPEHWEEIRGSLTNLTFGVNPDRLSGQQRADYDKFRNRILQGVFARDDTIRVYPNGRLAAHVLGFVGDKQNKINGRVTRQNYGRNGIELTMNSFLSGAYGWRQSETDVRRRELVHQRVTDLNPLAGLNVMLTLDMGLQQIVERELESAMKEHEPISASAIVVRPRTGEILAMATHPNFDPNRPGLAETAHRRNRVITDIFEPGSTFKIVVVSAALNEGIVTLQDRFNCEQGAFYYGGEVLHDHDSYGMLSVEKIITKSSNIGAAKVGIRLGARNLYDYMKRFGFGERTGIPLPGEQGGIVKKLETWRKVTITQIPMGHAVASTSLQMVMAMSAIANEGRMMRPMLVDRLLDEEGKTVAQYYPQQVRQVIQPETARHMVTALKTVVSTNGTARKADLEHYEVAGKTGTAQKVGRGGYLYGKYFASFIGFFPADNPELCISVVLDEPQHGYYGGQTAAPIFRNIARLAAVYLDIPPELDPQETMAARETTGRSGGLTPR